MDVTKGHCSNTEDCPGGRRPLHAYLEGGHGRHSDTGISYLFNYKRSFCWCRITSYPCPQSVAPHSIGSLEPNFPRIFQGIPCTGNRLGNPFFQASQILARKTLPSCSDRNMQDVGPIKWGLPLGWVKHMEMQSSSMINGGYPMCLSVYTYIYIYSYVYHIPCSPIYSIFVHFFNPMPSDFIVMGLPFLPFIALVFSDFAQGGFAIGSDDGLATLLGEASLAGQPKWFWWDWDGLKMVKTC